MKMEAPPGPSANSRRFVPPPLVHWLAASAVVFCAAVCLFALSLPWLLPGGANRLVIVACWIVFGSTLYLSLAIQRRSHDTVVVAEEGLWYLTPSGPAVFIRWGEIARVQAQNVMQRLAVTDSTGERRIYLEYHLQDFGDLRRSVLERASRRTPDVE